MSDRYRFEAYVFIFEALQYAHDVLQMGAERPPGRGRRRPRKRGTAARTHTWNRSKKLFCFSRRCAARPGSVRLHGQDGVEQWGLHGTGDLCEIVFNLIRTGQMRKTPSDARVDFDNVY